MTWTQDSKHDRRASPSRPGELLEHGLPHLLDERADPDFRRIFGLLARTANRLDSAVARIRLTGLDLKASEFERLERIRVLLAQVSALTLQSEADAVLADPDRAPNLKRLIHRLETEQIEVRSAPLAGWAPDFSIFRRNGHPWTLMVGLHWFARPYPHLGPALASVHGRAGAQVAADRFESLWKRAHDTRPAILAVLREAVRRAPDPSAARHRSERDRGREKLRPPPSHQHDECTRGGTP